MPAGLTNKKTITIQTNLLMNDFMTSRFFTLLKEDSQLNNAPTPAGTSIDLWQTAYTDWAEQTARIGNGDDFKEIFRSLHAFRIELVSIEAIYLSEPDGNNHASPGKKCA